MTRLKISALVMVLLGQCLLVGPAFSLDVLTLNLAGKNAELKEDLRAVSLLSGAKRDNITRPQEIWAAANADYGRILGALYERGFYGGVVRIQLDGQEAGLVTPFSIPTKFKSAVINVNTGPQFVFGTTRIAPTAAGTQLPVGFARGAVARSGVVQEAVETVIDQWRNNGFAKATPADQQFIADHVAQTLSVRVSIEPGPKVLFGKLQLQDNIAVRPDRIRRMAGLPTGEVFSPAVLDDVASRLRRSGAFRSVALSEGDVTAPDNRMDIELELVDEKPRRFGFGGEVSSLEGLTVSGFWMHRNFFGGAERLRIYGEIASIGGETGGVDYKLGARIEQPAAFGVDTKSYLRGELAELDEPNFRSRQAEIGLGAVWLPKEFLEFEGGVAFRYSEVEDDLGQRKFRLMTLPLSATVDRRDDALDASKGAYLNAVFLPFLDLDGTNSGGRLLLDGRGYYSPGKDKQIVLAGRLQFGAVVGPNIENIPPDYLFYSGGGGIVRGQPYQSLDVDLGGGDKSGGRSFVALSGEARVRTGKKFSVVGFYDAGYIGAESTFDGSGDWHAGAGLGLRYDTAIGPIRFDVAAPVSGRTGSGAQIYVGIGQAF